jgi:hypothetical protein
MKPSMMRRRADHDVGHELRVAEQGQRIVVHLDRTRNMREADVEIPAVGGRQIPETDQQADRNEGQQHRRPFAEHQSPEGR